MSLTRALLLQIQRSWERFAARSGLRNLPAMPAVSIVLALGLLVPMALKVDARPPELTSSLAQQRYERFAQTVRDPLTLGPQGRLLGPRPAFFWPAADGAERFTFRLYGADGTVLAADDSLRSPCFRLLPPGALAPGAYRFEARGYDKDGRDAGERIEGTFTVASPPDGFVELQRRTGLELRPGEAAWVMVGYFARHESPFDVISAYLAAAERAEGTTGRELQRSLRGGDGLSRTIERLISLDQG